MVVLWKRCISYVAQRYCKANNGWKSSHGKSKPSKHLIFKDTNNLYEHAMSRLLPTEFKMIEGDNLQWWY